jgi:hypothetical protein
MTRYVLTDLAEARAELARRSAEVHSWLDAAAGRPAPPHHPGEAALAGAVAQVDLLCVRALSETAARLASAAESVDACARAVHEVDAALARRLGGWAG